MSEMYKEIGILFGGVFVIMTCIFLYKWLNRRKTEELGVAEIEDSEKTWMVPEDKTEELWALWDDWSRRKSHSRLARYRFWKIIEELFPETKGKHTCFDPDKDAVRIVISSGNSGWSSDNDKKEDNS